ncbi:MAG: hypothetical protein AB7N91_24145 [Candidatus Tectimicrobiota bacterium]
MAGKFSRWFHADEEPAVRERAPRLSTLQQSILHWVRNEVRRRQRAGESPQIPYPDLVSAMHADKMAVTSDVQRLLRKGLLEMTLPPGAWVRYLSLTDKGDTQARRVAGDTGRKRPEEDERHMLRALGRRKKR